ncbi:MAG: efflux RND transporter periplasmic adaptor subunit [Isosphaeraceae bacterium]
MTSAIQSPTPVKRRGWGWLIVPLGVVAGIGLWYQYTRGAHTSAAKSTSASASAGESHPQESHGASEPARVETTHTTAGGIIRTSTQTGSIHAYEEADLFAKVSGYLKVLHVDYGDRVKKGQLLAEIEDPEIIKDADRAAAALLQAKAAVKQAEARVTTAQADKKAADAGVDQAKADIDRYISMKKYRQRVLRRHKDLVAKQAIPQEVADEDEEHYEASVSAERSSRAAEVTARAHAAAAQAKVEQARADLAEAQANVQVDEANLAKARVLVEYTQITSPYEGVITRRNFFRGAFIRSASEGNNVPLLTVARTDRVRVVTEVPDRDVPFTDVGDQAEVTLDALGGEEFKGKVSRFAETEDPTSRTMHTEIDLPNPKNKIRPGMYGIAKIILDASTKSSTLPSSCLVGESRKGKADVFVIKDGEAHKTEIEVGADDGIRVEVVSGLTPQDVVIASTSTVSEGTPVQSVRETAPPEEANSSRTAEVDRPATPSAHP